MINNTSVFLWGLMALTSLSACMGEKTVSDDSAEVKKQSFKVDADGDWNLISYRVGHETRVYSKGSDYILSFSDDDMTFDFTFDNDTVDGRYSVVNDTIRFHSDVAEDESHDELLLIVDADECYAFQDKDSMIVTLPDDSEAVFTRLVD